MNSQSDFHAEAWRRFVGDLPAIKAEHLEGEALWARIEAAWAPLFEGLQEDDCARVQEDCLVRLEVEGILPRTHLTSN